MGHNELALSNFFLKSQLVFFFVAIHIPYNRLRFYNSRRDVPLHNRIPPKKLNKEEWNNNKQQNHSNHPLELLTFVGTLSRKYETHVRSSDFPITSHSHILTAHTTHEIPIALHHLPPLTFTSKPAVFLLKLNVRWKCMASQRKVFHGKWAFLATNTKLQPNWLCPPHSFL